MSSVNRVMIIGNLGQDPEVRETQNGQAVCNLSVATNESWSDKHGERQERVEWHRVVCWGAVAEACGRYLEKGRQVYVEGRLETREWEDKDGIKRYTTEIIAQNVQFLGGGSGRDERGGRDQDRGRGGRESFERGARQARQGSRSGSREREPRRSGSNGGGRAPWTARGGR